MQLVSTEWLQSLPALQQVPSDQLQWLIDQSKCYELPEGEYLFVGGQPIKGTHFIIRGRIRMYLEQKPGGARDIGFFETGDISGYLPFSRGLKSAATGVATTNTQVMTFPIEKTKDLILQHFELTQALVHIMTSRVREFTTQQQQNEKMMALGKLSAGLAHELNNPASAVVRSATSLKKHLHLQPESFKKVMSIKMTPAQVDEINNRLFRVLQRDSRTSPLSLIERTAMEDELNDWLQDHHIDTNNDYAENFIDFGFDLDDLNCFGSIIPAQDLSPVLEWVNNNLVTEKMVTDIQEASQHIADLVSSVKNFTYMDRGGDREFIDVHSGLNNSLNMLRHRFKKSNVQLEEHYDHSLPPVHAYAGELNQVWINLIDNALDAMEANSKGVLEITTRRDGECVQVCITDDGPGVPEDIQSRIFDPFYTTKDIGKGTGLGLDVVKRIVDRHKGSINLKSVPGKTTFTVCFPFK